MAFRFSPCRPCCEGNVADALLYLPSIMPPIVNGYADILFNKQCFSHGQEQNYSRTYSVTVYDVIGWYVASTEAAKTYTANCAEPTLIPMIASDGSGDLTGQNYTENLSGLSVSTYITVPYNNTFWYLNIRRTVFNTEVHDAPIIYFYKNNQLRTLNIFGYVTTASITGSIDTCNNNYVDGRVTLTGTDFITVYRYDQMPNPTQAGNRYFRIGGPLAGLGGTDTVNLRRIGNFDDRTCKITNSINSHSYLSQNNARCDDFNWGNPFWMATIPRGQLSHDNNIPLNRVQPPFSLVINGANGELHREQLNVVSRLEYTTNTNGQTVIQLWEKFTELPGNLTFEEPIKEWYVEDTFGLRGCGSYVLLPGNITSLNFGTEQDNHTLSFTLQILNIFFDDQNSVDYFNEQLISEAEIQLQARNNGLTLDNITIRVYIYNQLAGTVNISINMNNGQVTSTPSPLLNEIQTRYGNIGTYYPMWYEWDCGPYKWRGNVYEKDWFTENPEPQGNPLRCLPTRIN